MRICRLILNCLSKVSLKTPTGEVFRRMLRVQMELIPPGRRASVHVLVTTPFPEVQVLVALRLVR